MIAPKKTFFERAKEAFKTGTRLFNAEPSHSADARLLEWEKQQEETILRSRRIQGLLDDPGFNAYIQELQAREENLVVELRSAPLTEVVRLQAQLKELHFAISLVPVAVADGHSAMRDLKEKDKEENDHG